MPYLRLSLGNSLISPLNTIVCISEAQVCSWVPPWHHYKMRKCNMNSMVWFNCWSELTYYSCLNYPLYAFVFFWPSSALCLYFLLIRWRSCMLCLFSFYWVCFRSSGWLFCRRLSVWAWLMFLWVWAVLKYHRSHEWCLLLLWSLHGQGLDLTFSVYWWR